MKKAILVSLDELLDTRVGVLCLLNEKYLDKIFAKDSQYFSRVIDDFEWIEPGLTARFKEAYDNRSDPIILSKSFRTQLVQVITHNIAEVMLSANEDPVFDGVSLDLNTYPYELTSEQKGWFRNIIREALVGDPERPGRLLFDLEVNTVNLPMADLTIPEIGKRWKDVYMYNFIDWTNARATDLNGQEMLAVNTNLFIPTLFREMPSRRSLKLPNGGRINPFEETQRNFALWIALRYMNPKYFSIPDPSEPG